MNNDRLTFLVGANFQVSQCNWAFNAVLPNAAVYMSYFTRNHFLCIAEDHRSRVPTVRVFIIMQDV